MKTLLITLITISFAPGLALANSESMNKKVERGYEKTKDATAETYEDAKKGTKKAYRKVKDETCEMVNGKMECTAKRVSNKTKNAVDEAKDKSNDLKKHN